MIGFLRTPGNGLPSGKELAAKWLELGSLDKVSRWLGGQGIVNRDNGRPISRQAIHQRIWEWVFRSDENLNFIKVLVKKSHHSRGVEWDEEWWIEFILRKAVSHTTPAKFDEWVNEHGYQSYVPKIYSRPTTRGF